MRIVKTDNATYNVNPCPHCKNDTIEYCPEDEPWNTEKWACSYCDSTYVIFNEEVATKVSELNMKTETKNIESGIIHVPWRIISTPYMILSDSRGTRKVWIKSKRKIALYYLYKFTRIKWFIEKYNE